MKPRLARLAILASTALSSAPALAGDLPTGGSVAHGSVEISRPASGRMTIRQSSADAVVNWNGFSVGNGARVDIAQPTRQSALLNRVTGSTPSNIAGRVTANGRVYLVNPNGIVITRSGTIDSGAFVASTLDIGDDAFLSGAREFSGTGRSAAVINRGTIELSRGGYAALIGGRIDNLGTISVPMGRIGLAAGERATLDLSGDGFLQVAVPSEGDGEAALVEHSGTLSADGGRVEIKAAAARRAARNAINLSGVVEARTVSQRGGAIVLGGGLGRVSVTGRLEANAPRPPAAITASPAPAPRPERGGRITVTGETIALRGATLDTSGAAGGGEVRIGGDLQGGGTLPRSRLTVLDAAARVLADATVRGDGGRVIVWSDGLTSFAGGISATGGPEGGDGGFAEVSGRAQLAFSGDVDLSAPQGAFGTLLLDPFNVTISDAEDDNVEFNLDAIDEFGLDDGSYTPVEGSAVINAGLLAERLQDANVTITTSGDGDQEGNISVEAPVSWDSGANLTLLAANAILVGEPLSFPGGSLTLTAQNVATEADLSGAGGTLTVNATNATTNGAVSVGSGSATFAITNGLEVGGEIEAVGGAVNLQADNLTLGAPVDVGFGALTVVASAVDLNGTITAPGGLVDVAATGPLAVNAAITAGSGGVVALEADALTSSTPIAVGDGDLEIAARAIEIGGPISAPGTFVDIASSGGPFALNAAITAEDGFVEISQSAGGIFLGAPISVPGGTLLIGQSPGPGGGEIAVGAGGAVNVGSFGLGGTWIQDTGPLAAFAADDFQLFSGTFLRAAGGSGSRVDPYLITDVYGLQGIDSASLLADHFALTQTIDATGTADWNVEEGGDNGFNPIGQQAQEGAGFTGSLDGRQNAIDGLFIRNNGELAGLFESLAPSEPSTAEVMVQDLRLTGVDIAGVGFVGGLAGRSTDGTIERSFVTGALATTTPEVTPAETEIGGLIGRNLGTTITDVYADVVIDAESSGQELFTAGGLVGNNQGEIQRAYSAGSVGATGDLAIVADTDPLRRIGGFVGVNFAEIVDAYSTTDVSVAGEGDSQVGGFAGMNFGSLTRVHSAGAVSGSLDPGVLAIGGLVGSGDPSGVDPAFWDLQASGQAASPGGGLGLTTAQFQDTEAFLELAQSEGWTGFQTTWAPSEPGRYPDLYTISPVIWADPDDQTVQYGDPVDPTGEVFGGPEFYVFDEAGDSIDPSGLFVSPAASGSPVGTYPVTVGPETITSANGLTYEIVDTEGTLTITPAPLTVTVLDFSKRYGVDLDLSQVPFTTDGLVAGDNVEALTLASEGAAPGAPVAGSPYPIVATGVSGPGFTDGAENYDIDFVDGALTVTPAPLAFVIGDISKQYGVELDLSDPEFSTSGLVNDDTIETVEITSDGAPATAPVAGSPYPIVVEDIDGPGISVGGVSNYALDIQAGDVIVTPAPLRIRLRNASKDYGEELNASDLGFVARGLANGDQVETLDIVSAGLPARAPVAGSPYDIEASGAAGPGLEVDGVPNYEIEVVEGRLTVSPADLTITADDQAKVFGTEFVFDGSEFSQSGLVDGDRIDRVALSSEGAPALAPVEDSPYAIEIGDVEGDGLIVDGVPNYAITRVPGDLTVTLPEEAQVLVDRIAGIVALENPNDVIQVSLSGNLAGSIAEAEDALAFVQRISQQLEAAVARCSDTRVGVGDFLSCLTGALDQYAAELEARIVDLPEELGQVSAIIRQASREIEATRATAVRRIEAATSDDEIRAIEQQAGREALASVRTAADEIRKAIELIRADDPQLASVQEQQGDVITAALETVEIELTRAVGL